MKQALVFPLVAALFVLPPVAHGVERGVKCSAEQGQALIDQGRYKDAVREFTCLVDAQPTEVEGYRGRIEAELLLGRYSDAVLDYVRVARLVEPVHPDTERTVLDGYDARLAADPESVPALTGVSFARWWYFDYPQAINLLDRLLTVRPDDVYGTLFRGSSRALQGVTKKRAVPELDRAIELAPKSPDVRYVVADAYTYGLPDPQRAFAEASLALAGGLDTPRVHAILAAAYNAFGDLGAGAQHIMRHLDLVTTELVATAPLPAGGSFALDLVPGRTYEIPVAVTAGETLSIATSSHDFWDTIAVLLAPDGTPVVGSDDDSGYYAAFNWPAGMTGIFRLRVSSFEAAGIGTLLVKRG